MTENTQEQKPTWAEVKPEGTAQPDRISRMEGVYLCPELRDQPYRAGSQDAQRISSRGMG